MKKPIKIYLEQEDINRLKDKANAIGFTGRGSISRYIEKLSRESVIFLDSNCKAMLEALKLQPKENKTR